MNTSANALAPLFDVSLVSCFLKGRRVCTANAVSYIASYIGQTVM